MSAARSFAGGGGGGGNPPSDSGSPRAGGGGGSFGGSGAGAAGGFGGGGSSSGGGGTSATPTGGGTSGGNPGVNPSSHGGHTGGHNGGTTHSGNWHGNRGGYGGHGHGGYGGYGHRGYYYPTFWGSVFFGYPYPYWWYGPWGWGYAGGGYYHREDRSEQGALDLDLSPADTQVYLDGEYIGTVDDFDGWPQYLWLDPGTYDIVFYREGYKTLARQVTIYRGLVIDWDDKLEKGPSIRPEDLQTKVHERRDARLDQDREMREKAERGESPGWRDRVRDERSRPVPPPPGAPGAPGASAEPRGDYRSASRLRLTVEPSDASVYLDGRFLGTGEDLARLPSGVLIDPGPHTLSVVRPGRHAEERKFDVKVDDQVELKIVLANE